MVLMINMYLYEYGDLLIYIHSDFRISISFCWGPWNGFIVKGGMLLCKSKVER